MSKVSNKLSTLAQLVEKKKQAENDKLKVCKWHDDINDITFTFNKCDMDMLLELTEKYPKAFGYFSDNSSSISISHLLKVNVISLISSCHLHTFNLSFSACFFSFTIITNSLHFCFGR